VIGAIGCAAQDHAPEITGLEEAEDLCLGGQFIEAEPLLRAYLRSDSTSAVAHYYLGRCYLSDDLINLPMARGEITAALVLFQEFGQVSPQARFTDEYFELMCLTDIAKTYLSEIAMEIPRIERPAVRQREAKARIALCEDLVARAKRVNPDAELTTWLRLNTAQAAASIEPRNR
jgi:hypothetical protein